MKQPLFALFALLCCGCFHALAQPAAGHFTPADGLFVFRTTTTVGCDEALLPQARYLAAHLGCPVVNRMAGKGAIALILSGDTTPANPEGYTLRILPEAIVVEGATPGGIFNGIQALLRRLPAEVYAGKGVAAGTQVACGRVADAPRFGYRGMMLDVCRTWMDAQSLRRYIDLLAYHNINKLHLLLTNDEGWRIEILSHPDLTAVGAYRGGDSPVRAVYGKWSEKYGGYYTQDEMRELIRYAAERNIEIIPEIDLPGHSRNIASVRPEIRCNYPPDTVLTNGYDYRSAWCVAREENYALLEDILGEICALFPSEYIHVGGDEVDFSQWERCPDCRALMQRRGMQSAGELEDLFMARMAEILARHGKRPGVWNEAARTGDFTRESLVYGWESVRACRDAVNKGYHTVVMPGEYFYFDMRQSKHEDGHDWAAIFDARKVYGFDFAKAGFTEEQLQRVEGLEGSFFSEAYVSHEPEKPDYIDCMCFPRICALARIAWSGNTAPWSEFYDELRRDHYDRMVAMGIHFRLFPPKLTWSEGKLSVMTDDGSEVWYIEEGDTTEYRLTTPLHTDYPHRYRFRTRYGTARSPYVAHASYYKTIAPQVAVTTSMGESSKFPYTNASTYRGISRTRRACRQRDWILYTFAEPLVCRELLLQTGNRQLPKTIITTGYVEISYDGRNFQRAGELEKGSITLRPERAVQAVRIVSTCDDNGTPYVTIQPPVVKPRL